MLTFAGLSLMVVSIISLPDDATVQHLRALAATDFLEWNRSIIQMLHDESKPFTKSDSTWSIEKVLSWDRVFEETRLCTTLAVPFSRTVFYLFGNPGAGVDIYCTVFQDSVSEGLLRETTASDSVRPAPLGMVQLVNRFISRERVLTVVEIRSLATGICTFSGYGGRGKIISSVDDIVWEDDTTGISRLKYLLATFREPEISTETVKMHLWYWDTGRRSHVWDLCFLYDTKLRQLSLVGRDYGQFGAWFIFI
jgi:hypothetical protein